jgi:hypothetical protein
MLQSELRAVERYTLQGVMRTQGLPQREVLTIMMLLLCGLLQGGGHSTGGVLVQAVQCCGGCR